MNKKRKIQVIKNGPYSVTGGVPLNEEKITNNAEGFPNKWEETKNYPLQDQYLLCRCGKSKNMPFCDQSHKKNNFDGKETSGKTTFNEQAKKYDGPDLVLKDAVPLCVHAGFCDRDEGIWELIKKSDDSKSKKTAIEEAANCPSGRLVVFNKKTKKEIEPKSDQSISVTFSAANVAGSLWVKGGIPIESSDDKVYELRNRVTLCQCGKSKNKPFCDGSHYQTEQNKTGPIDELIMEHGSIKVMLRILEKINEKIVQTKNVNYSDIDDGITFIKGFADKCHHGKEEDLLFPTMKKQNIAKEIELIEILIEEHKEGREYVKKMADRNTFLENSQKYIALLDQHIDKENMRLFKSAKVSLEDNEIKDLEEGFEDVEINKIGAGRHEELYKIIEKLQNKYL